MIVYSKISSIDPGVGDLVLAINNNLTLTNKVGRNSNLILNLETSQRFWDTESKQLRKKIKHLRSDLSERDEYLRSKLRIYEGRCRRCFH